MKTILLAAATAAVVGAGAAIVTTTLTAEPASEPALAQLGEDSRVEDLARELEEVQAKNQDLAARIAYLEARPTRVEAAPGGPAEAPELSLDEETRQLVAAMTASSGAEVPPQLQETVLQALTNIREQEERERQREAEEAQQERVDERLEELREELGLNRYQTDQMRTAMLDFNTKRTELFQKVRDSGDWGSMRGNMRDMYSEYRDNLEQILTPIQLEQYEESDRGPGGPPGRGRGDDDGGRGGRRDT